MKTILSVLFLFTILFTGPVQAQSTQTVRGRILDEASKSALIGATVVLEGSSPLLGATADVDGNFKISKVPIGRQNFRVQFMGYEARVISNVIVTAGKEVVLDIALTESVVQMQEAVVTAKRSENKLITNNEMALISGRSFNVDDTKRYAGALGDPARMAANFAGVIAGNDSRNDIVVRGNSPAGMLWQMEGLNIPNPNHYGAINTTGGPVSMLNNNTLGKSDFITSAFPSQYGNGLSGVFDLRLRNGNDEKREYLGQMGFNGFELGAEGPFSKTNPKKGSYLVNYRYSTLALFNELGIQFGTGNAVPNYQDINYKVNVPLSSKVTLSLFGIGGLSDVNFEGNKEDTTGKNLYGNENENSRVNFGTIVTGASVDVQAGPSTNFKLTTGFAATGQEWEGDSISVETRQAFRQGTASFKTQKYSLNGQLTHKFDSRNTLHAGFYNDLFQYQLFNEQIYKATEHVTFVDLNGNWYLGQAYAQWKHRFTQRLSVTPGVHVQYTTQGEAFAVEPRIQARYNLTENQSVNVGYGIHNQMQSVYNYAVETHTAAGTQLTNKDLGFTRSQHFVVGTERLLSDNTTLKVEGYYQLIDKAPITSRPGSYSALNSGNSFNPDNEDSLVNKGLGRNYGVELTLERTFSHGFYYLVTGSLFDSRYKGADGVWRNTAFNTGYAANVLVGKEWKVGKSKNNVLAVNVKFTTIGGRYLTPLNFEESRIAQQAKYDESRAFSERQTPYLRSDVKLSYRREFTKSTLEFSLDLQNITNHNNVFNQQYNRRTNKIITQYQQGFFPVPFVRYTF